MREQRHFTRRFRGPRYNLVSPRRDLLDALSIGDGSVPNEPTRRVLSDVGGGDALVNAVVPLLEIVVDLGNAAISRQPRRFTRPRAGTGQDQGELSTG